MSRISCQASLRLLVMCSGLSIPARFVVRCLRTIPNLAVFSQEFVFSLGHPVRDATLGRKRCAPLSACRRNASQVGNTCEIVPHVVYITVFRHNIQIVILSSFPAPPASSAGGQEAISRMDETEYVKPWFGKGKNLFVVGVPFDSRKRNIRDSAVAEVPP